jgi:membrane associated rhomboid family serine protease
MGIYDRDYYRNDRRWRNPFGRVYVTLFLCVFYAAMLIAQEATREVFRRPNADAPINNRNWTSGLTAALELDGDKVVEGQLWRVLSYGMVNNPYSSILSLVISVVFLVWIGHQVEDLYGSKEYLAYFLFSVLLGGIAYTLIFLIKPDLPPLWGPIGAITSILVLFVLHYPNRKLPIGTFISVPAWLALIFYIVLDLLFLSHGLNPGIVAVHLVGGVFAFLYHTYTLRISTWAPSWRRLASGSRKAERPRLRVYQEHSTPQPAASVATAPSLTNTSATAILDEHLEAKLDEVLEKVMAKGKDSLTDAERDILNRASAIYKKRRESN